jgi:hypothetical protein
MMNLLKTLGAAALGGAFGLFCLIAFFGLLMLLNGGLGR